MESNNFCKIKEKVLGDDTILHEYFYKFAHMIESKGVNVCPCSDKQASSYENGIIRVSCHQDASKGWGVLWDLLHEYGHHCDNDMSSVGRTPREYRAWKIAEKLIIDDGICEEYLNDFDVHRNRQLYTYRWSDLKRWKDRVCNVILENNKSEHGKYVIMHSDGRLCLTRNNQHIMVDGNKMIDVQPYKKVNY